MKFVCTIRPSDVYADETLQTLVDYLQRHGLKLKAFRLPEIGESYISVRGTRQFNHVEVCRERFKYNNPRLIVEPVLPTPEAAAIWE